MVTLHESNTKQHFADARSLILEYVKWLDFDLSFQNFDQEMASLPAMYNSSDGGLFVVYLNSEPAGVIGLRRFSETEGLWKSIQVPVIAAQCVRG